VYSIKSKGRSHKTYHLTESCPSYCNSTIAKKLIIEVETKNLLPNNNFCGNSLCIALLAEKEAEMNIRAETKQIINELENTNKLLYSELERVMKELNLLKLSYQQLKNENIELKKV
jgi:hypothetical protein